MKSIRMATGLLTTVLLVVTPVLGIAADTSQNETTQREPDVRDTQSQVAMTKLPIYRPPQVGRPHVRLVGAGTRGREEMITLSVLTPEQAGLTASDFKVANPSAGMISLVCRQFAIYALVPPPDLGGFVSMSVSLS